jgi:hypothetical protein
MTVAVSAVRLTKQSLSPLFTASALYNSILCVCVTAGIVKAVTRVLHNTTTTPSPEKLETREIGGPANDLN